jgi:hypothetical protein
LEFHISEEDERVEQVGVNGVMELIHQRPQVFHDFLQRSEDLESDEIVEIFG